VKRLKERIKEKENKPRKIKKITRYPDTKDLEPLNECKFLETLTKKASFHTPKFVSTESLCVKHVRTIFPSPPLIRESTFGFKPGTRSNRNIKSRHDSNPQSTLEVHPSFEENTPPVTYPDEVEEIIGIPIEVEPLDETTLKDLGLNTCNHDIPLSSREIPNFDEPEPQPQPFFSFPSLEVYVGHERGLKPPIKPLSPDSFRMKEVESLTIHIPPLPHVTYYHPGLGNPKKYYVFKPGLLGQSGSLGVEFLNLETIEDDWELESKEVSFLGRGLNLPVRPK
ncbi:hypothetical protein Tco_0463100, partial [Tanacetum coccineum]